MRNHVILALAVFSLGINLPFAQGQDLGGFEMWEDTAHASKVSAPLAMNETSSNEAGQIKNPPAVKVAKQHAQATEQVETEVRKKAPALPENTKVEESATEEFNPIIRFGAGATYLISVRPSDVALGDKILTEFSASWCPFGAVAEIGFDMAIARDNTFFARPNLKLFIVRNNSFGLFLEGNFAIYSHSKGIDLGGGAAIGTVTGITDHLAIEAFVAAMVFSMSADGAKSIVSGGFLGDPGDGSGLVVMPYAGLRLTARF
ncbi:MAG: hypothetical protein JRJ19_13665 [Deltaproteobacteria bacterium]|nr:hypothetical protein [Deltaproteobacteria bacterium]MBW1873111.1 hypothetical protein [Deltaproteobacteria bacterium]